MPWLDNKQLSSLGLAAVGDDVLIDSDARFIGASRIRIGSHVRIDAFSILSAGAGGITIGNHVHIAVQCFLTGAAPIEFEDFSAISGRTLVYSSTDDYSGAALTGPMVPDQFRNVISAPVRLARHALVGAGSVILPGVVLGEGSAVGAMSLVREDVPPFTIVAGVPARRLEARSRRLLELERELADGR
jgi:galactoside O-acetyltransferase